MEYTPKTVIRTMGPDGPVQLSRLQRENDAMFWRRAGQEMGKPEWVRLAVLMERGFEMEDAIEWVAEHGPTLKHPTELATAPVDLPGSEVVVETADETTADDEATPTTETEE